MERHSFEKLYALASTGKVKTWQIEVHETMEGIGIITTSHGYLDGKIQSNPKLIKKGKNIGKSNETTPYQQAFNEAESKWKSKKDQNYIETIPDPNDAPKIILPMLAIDFNKRSHNITYPALAQAKLDGVRCLAIRKENEIIFQSRNGKIYDTLDHLVSILLDQMKDGDIFDGEIYCHGWSFQKIISAVKKKNEDTPLLQFWVYDKAVTGVKFIERLHMLENTIYINSYIKILRTEEVANKNAVLEMHDPLVREGFEGVIIRNVDGEYVFDYRSKDLQKYKKFKDEEFVIVGYDEGTGLEAGCIIFICRQEDGLEFRVRPKGSRELRREWFKDAQNIIGKELTVRHQEPRTDDNIPRFPVGIAIRDYE